MLTKYDWKEIKQKIIEYSKIIKIDKIGFASAEPFKDIENVLKEHRDKGYSSGFEEKDIELRIEPKLSLLSVRSIISIALAYPSQEPEGYKGNEIRGKFCRASWGKDYHVVLKGRLDKLSDYIKLLVPEVETLVMVDTGPLADRSVAARAGLGWIGKNGSLITPEYGSFVFLGELLTNLPLPSDEPMENKCGNCEKCIMVCPMQAILPEKLTINCQKCLAYQTLNKGFLNDELKEKIAFSKYIYGCDICQLACPYNKDKCNDWHKEFQPHYDLINPLLKELLKISNKDFRETYGHMSGSWRGKKNLQRNAILILGKGKDISLIPLLKDILVNDSRPEIRGAAAWALGKFDSEETQKILEKILEKEKDEQAICEIKKALKRTNGFKEI